MDSNIIMVIIYTILFTIITVINITVIATMIYSTRLPQSIVTVTEVVLLIVTTIVIIASTIPKLCTRPLKHVRILQSQKSRKNSDSRSNRQKRQIPDFLKTCHIQEFWIFAVI